MKAARDRLDGLREERESQESAVDRLEERTESARDDAAAQIAEAYSGAAEALLKQKTRAMRSLATALEKIQVLKQKASENGLRRSERLPPLTATVKKRDGGTVGPDRLRYLADRLEDRTG